MSDGAIEVSGLLVESGSRSSPGWRSQSSSRSSAQRSPSTGCSWAWRRTSVGSAKFFGVPRGGVLHLRYLAPAERLGACCAAGRSATRTRYELAGLPHRGKLHDGRLDHTPVQAVELVLSQQNIPATYSPIQDSNRQARLSRRMMDVRRSRRRFCLKHGRQELLPNVFVARRLLPVWAWSLGA